MRWLRLPARRATRPARRGSGKRHGFTMVEVLTVALVMGTLARMAVPNFHEVLLKARAAEVSGTSTPSGWPS